jgi:GAF domain-containing protein
MLARFRKILQAPLLEDPEKNIRAQHLAVVLRSVFILTVIYLLYTLFFPPPGQVVIAAAALVFEVGLWLLIKNRLTQLAGVLFVTMLWLAVLAEVILYGGIRDSGFASFAIVLTVAILTIGIRAGLVYTFITILAGVALAFAESKGWLPPYVNPSIGSVVLSYSITFTTVSLLLYLAIRSITRTTRTSLANEKAQREINQQLEEDRTRFEQQIVTLEERNTNLQTIVDVARLSSQIRSEDELLQQVASLLANQLKTEHVAVFLLNQVEENAPLRASNSPQGQALAAKGYQLRVIRSELAFAIYGSALLHYLVGAQNYYIDLPEPLSDAKVNLSFPLISSEHLLGLINIQSTSLEPQSLDQQALQTLADQIALSIENMRLLGQLQARVREISLLAGESVQSAWEQVRGGKSIGYYYDQLQVLSGNEVLPAKISEELLAEKSVAYVTSEDIPRARLIAPIILRGNTIGVIGYEDSDSDHKWQETEKTLLEAIASRVSLALENTRLVAEAQERAERERALGQVAARIRETLDVDAVLRTAVQEMKQTFKLDQAEVRLQLIDGNEESPAERNL